ncbi:MAG: hypothetical protein LC803_21640 [Acidobacteria bacterium]|nr:hypothetical protein [Acidobacteriota bacterium]
MKASQPTRYALALTFALMSGAGLDSRAFQRGASPCSFRGPDVEQARCLLRRVRKYGEVDREPATLSRAIADPLGEAAALNGLARVERDRDNLTGALKLSDEALGVVESLRTRVASQRLRTSYFATSQNYYEVYIDVRMRLYRRTGAPEHAAAALQASERARARSLIDTLLEAGVDIRQGVSDDLLRRAREVQQKLNVKANVQTKLLSEGKATGDQAAAVKKEIANLISEYDSVLAKIRRASPKYAGLTQPPSPALVDIQQRLLDDDTLLLEFALGDEKSHLWIVQAVIETGGGKPVQTRDDLKVTRAGGASRVSVIVPAQRLSDGDYLVRLSGMNGGRRSPIGVYDFRITRK